MKLKYPIFRLRYEIFDVGKLSFLYLPINAKLRYEKK